MKFEHVKFKITIKINFSSICEKIPNHNVITVISSLFKEKGK